MHEGTPRFSFATDRGRYELWVPAKGVALQRVSGHGNVEMVRVLTEQLEKVLAETSPLSLFDDFEALESYDADARALITAWTKDNLAKLRGVHVLVRSRVVAAGISIANVALHGAMRSHTERARFEAAFRLELDHARAVKTP